MQGRRREAKSLLEAAAGTEAEAVASSSSSSSSEVGSDPLLISAPVVTDSSHSENDNERLGQDDDDDDGEDMHSAMEVMVRFQDDDEDEDQKSAKDTTSTTTTTTTLRDSNNSKWNAILLTTPTRKTMMIRKWLDFYVTFLQASPMHQDRLLKALQWTMWLASAVLVEDKHRRGNNNNNNNNSSSSSSSMALYKLSLDLSFARYATRLLELPVAVQAAWTGCWTAKASSSSSSSTKKEKLQNVYNWLGRGLSWSMVGYYPAEYAAYLLWMLPVQLQTAESNRRAAKFSAWSCRCWLVYLVSDLVQSLLQWKEQQQQLQLQQQQEENMGEHTMTTTTTTAALMTSAKLQSLRSALFLLPCIHWALPNWDTKPWLPTKVVNGLMWMEAMVSLYQSSLAYLPGIEKEENEDMDTDKKEN